jgi:hypothetical protein
MASSSDQNTDATASPFEVVKDYDPRGEWTLHRLASATNFTCGRCTRDKKAKLVATRNNQWDDICCNGCYGKLLSTEWYEVYHAKAKNKCSELTSLGVRWWFHCAIEEFFVWYMFELGEDRLDVDVTVGWGPYCLMAAKKFSVFVRECEIFARESNWKRN